MIRCQGCGGKIEIPYFDEPDRVPGGFVCTNCSMEIERG